MNEDEVLSKVCRAVTTASEQSVVPQPHHRLIDDLGFDSLRVASLAIELEVQFGQAVLLNDWIAAAPQLSALTVQSLADHLRIHLEEP
jgi:acyl carrier protein